MSTAPLAPPVLSPARLTAALGASLALHGAALGLASQVASGWSPMLSPAAAAAPLHAKLVALASPEPPQPAPSPSTPAAPERPRAGKPKAEPQREEDQSARALGALPGPVYLPVSELDQRPLIKEHVEPRFPPGAPVESGRVLLRLNIGEDGRVEEILVLGAEPEGVFESSAIEAFAAAQFIPGMKGGRAVRSTLAVEALFGSPPSADRVDRVPGWGTPQAPRVRPPRRKSAAP